MTTKGWDKGCLDKLWGVLMLWSWWSATCQLILNTLYWFERPKFGLKESKQSQPNGSKIFRLNFPRVLYDAYKLRTSQSAHRQCRGQRCLEVEVPFEAEKVSWAVSVASMALHFWDAHFVTVSFLFVLDISCSRVDVFLRVKAASWGRQPLRNNSPKKWPIVHPVIEMHIYPLCVHTTTSQNSPVDVSFLAPLMLFMLRTIGLTVLVLLRGQSCCHGCHILNTDNRPYMPFNCVWRWFTPRKASRKQHTCGTEIAQELLYQFWKTKRPREHPQNQATFSESWSDCHFEALEKMAAWGRIADADDGDSISNDSISIEQYCFTIIFLLLVDCFVPPRLPQRGSGKC